MAKIRSPNFPMLDLGTALKAARKAFEKDHRNKISKGALAKHLGHDRLSGPVFGKIGALRAYGLIEGKGDELKITDDAVHALMAPEGSTELSAAMLKLATHPKLFHRIRKEFPTPPSADKLEFWLDKLQFSSDAAERATKNYLATMLLVEGGAGEYDSGDEPALDRHPTTIKAPMPRGPMLQEVFNLDEGPVILTFPASLSAESYQDLVDYLSLFVRKAKRNADATRQSNEMIGHTGDE